MKYLLILLALVATNAAAQRSYDGVPFAEQRRYEERRDEQRRYERQRERLDAEYNAILRDEYRATLRGSPRQPEPVICTSRRVFNTIETVCQ